MVEQGDRALVFVSYSREDAEWRRRFVEMLSPLVRERRLEVWSDERNLVGEQWRPQLAEAIGRSRAALLLVSRTFLASDFIMRQELPALVERGVRLVCVLVGPCLWDEVEALERVQWAHDPRRDGPVASSSDPEGQIVRVCKQLLALLPGEAGGDAPRQVPGGGSAVAGPRVAALERVERPGDLHGVPPLPGGYVAREEVAGLRDALVAAGDGAVGITGNARALGLHGQGGIGKTVLAAALARDHGVRRHFPGGVFWVTVGERGDPVAAQIDLLARLGVAHPELRSATQGLELLRAALAGRQCLLVVDDVWSSAAATAFRATGPRGRILYTTRDPAVLHAVDADIERIEVLSPRAARQLLASLAGMPIDALPAEADLILEATGRGALALALVGAAVGRGGRSWQDVVEQLDRASRTFLDHPYANTFKAMQVGVDTLDALAEAYRSLAVYPEDTVVPVAAVARHWEHLWGFSAAETKPRLEVLAAHELLTLERDGFRFHDLQREFLLLEASDLRLAHADLLGAYRALLPSDADAWSALPHREPYIWEHLIYHLRGAGDAAGVLGVVTDLAYLAVRSFRGGPYAAEAELRQAAALDRGPAIEWLLRLFTQWGHLFADHSTIGDLAATLASRTSNAPAPVNAKRLAALLPTWFLAPRWGLPDAPPALTRVLEGHAGWVTAVAFSPDGHQLACGGGDGTVRLWDAASGQPTGTLEGHIRSVNGVAFSPDGRQLASAADDGTVRLWDAARGQPTGTLEGHTGAVRGVAFSPDGRQLASAGDDGTVRLWDAASGQPTGTLEGHTGVVRGVAFSPDGRQLASAADDRTVRLWDAASGQLTTTLEDHTGWVRGVAFSPDGCQLASAADDRTVRLWVAASGQLTGTLEAHTDYSVTAVAFSPDGRQLASAGHDGTVRMWDAVSGKPTATLEGHTGAVHGVAFSPDGHELASAGNDGTVRLWDAASGQPTATPEADTGWVRGVAFSPDGRQLASAGNDGTVRLWDAASGQPTGTLEADTDWVRGVAFSPDGRQLASAGNDGTVRLWDTASRQPTATLAARTDSVRGVAFSPDGRRLASAGNDGTVRLWDTASRQPTGTLEGHTGWVNAVAFSPDGRQLASAADDRTVRLWDTASRQPTGTLEGHTGWVNAVAFSPDARQLASAADDRTVRLWDTASRQPTATLDGHTGAVTAVAFSPDGHQLASAGSDGAVRLWDGRDRSAISQLWLGVAVEALAWGPCGITVAAYTSVIQLELSIVRPETEPAISRN